ncbi:hypothetical protein AB0K21_21530 [Streptosporangium sp. NPDC049248]|uniref:hypothetical protein n=1 Tax=Streptosporangium sp. NPDC049248 TaxID=3155651 RepID=UPI00342D7C4D
MPLHFTRNELVATGDPAMNAYLQMARTMRVPQCTLEDAEDALTKAQERHRHQVGDRDSVEHLRRYVDSYARAKEDADDAWEREKVTYDTAREGDPHAYDLVCTEVEAMWNDFYLVRRTPRDARW